MDNRTRNRNLLFIIAILILTNIAVLGYFLWYKKPPAPKNDFRNGMSEMLKRDVGFTDQQVAQYDTLRDQQRASIKPMFDEMRKAKENLFRLLSDPNATDSIVKKATEVIAEQQKSLDLQTFNHFKKVRSLCTPEQQPKYDSMVQRMFRKMGRPQRRTDAGKEEKK
jgi:Spy/CpxP family protein refolding chaperone